MMETNDILSALIQSEVDAVNYYDKALKEIKHPAVIKKLTEIRDEEVKHIEELNKLIFDDEELTDEDFKKDYSNKQNNSKNNDFDDDFEIEGK